MESFRDLIRTEINVFKFNVIPLLYIYISEKKSITQELNPRGQWHMQTDAVAD